jgi:hypothetical protein
MLDMTQVAGQIADAGQRERERQTRAAEDTARAAERTMNLDAAAWLVEKERVKTARTSWLVAHAADGLPGARLPAPQSPCPPHVVVATDGSQIAPDRHDGGGGGCYLLNVGRVFLSYGTGTRPRLDARAEVLVEEDGGGEEDGEERIAAGLAPRRFAREMRELSGLVEEAAATGLPAVALTDGSLIAWHLYDEEGTDAAKQEGFDALMAALATAEQAGVPLVGYVSGPASRDAVNALRVTLCPDEPVDCLRCPRPKDDSLPCAPVRRATDASLYARLLAPGERSAVFTSYEQKTGFSRVLRMYRPADWVAFFYLNVGAEVARVEIPAWVAEDADLVARVHAVCLDQARKGRGYPVALAEAHERAVVRGADRQAFLNLLHRAMVHAGAPVVPTRKALAKRTRAI